MRLFSIKIVFRKALNALCALFSYSIGHIYAFLYYDKKYLTGKWFTGRFNGLYAIGWEWVRKDARNCRRFCVNRSVKWPTSALIKVVHPDNITFHPDDINIFQGVGNYYQAIGQISIGRGTYIAQNVGIITANHDLNDLDKHMPAQPVKIGAKCWIGMNSVILPGVTLGDNTVVGAGSIVTHSFPEGHCVIAGNPARIMRRLDIIEGSEG